MSKTKRKRRIFTDELKNKLFSSILMANLNLKFKKNMIYILQLSITGLSSTKQRVHLKVKIIYPIQKKNGSNFVKEIKNLKWRMIF